MIVLDEIGDIKLLLPCLETRKNIERHIDSAGQALNYSNVAMKNPQAGIERKFCIKPLQNVPVISCLDSI